MKNLSLALIGLLLPIFSIGQDCMPRSENFKVLISEFSQGHSSTNEEFIELIVVGDPGIVDLSGYVIDDNNAPGYGNGNQSGHIRLGRCFSEVETGTIILIYNDKEVHPNIASASDGKMIIPFSSKCISKHHGCPNQSNTGYDCAQSPSPNSLWTNLIPLHNQGDCIRILDSEFNIVQSIAWGTSNNFIPPYFKVTSEDNISGEAFGLSSISPILSSSNYIDYNYTEATPGSPNNELIKEVLEESKLTAEMLEINIEVDLLQDDNGQSNGAALVNIAGGSPPYSVVNFDGLSSNVNQGVTSEFFLSGLTCGTYEFEIEDQNGCTSKTVFEIERKSDEEYFLCIGNCIRIDPIPFCTSEDICVKWEGPNITDEDLIIQEFCLEESANYSVIIIGQDGNILEEREISIEVSSNIPSFSLSASPNQIPINGMSEIRTISGLLYSHEWKRGNEIVGFKNTLSVGIPGVYTLEATDKYGCQSTSSMEIFASDQNNDTDNDGVNDLLDCNSTNPDIYPGKICDDLNDCTREDKYDENCNCIGISIPNCSSEEYAIGTPCDDNDPCTENDAINDDCICIGENIEDCFQCVQGTPCDDGNPCTASDNFDENCNCIGAAIQDCSECEEGKPCDDGNSCTADDMFDIDCECRGVSKQTPSIVSDNTCSSGMEYLSISSTMLEYSWLFEDEIISNESNIEIITPGVYSALVVDDEGCIFEVEYYKQLPIYLTSSQILICDAGQPIIINLENNESNSSILWNTGETNTNSISVPEGGPYSITVTDSENCTSTQDIKVFENTEDQVQDLLEENGFVAIDVTIDDIVMRPNGNDTANRNNSCEVENYASENFIVRFPDNSTLEVKEYICNLISESGSDFSTTGGIFTDDLCSIDFDRFLHFDSEFESGSISAFLIPSTISQSSKLYIKNALSKDCIISDYSRKSNNLKFANLLSEILCLYHNNKEDQEILLQLPNYDAGYQKNFFSGEIILFDGIPYSNSFQSNGFIVQNNISGGIVDLKGFETLIENPTSISSVCIRKKNNKTGALLKEEQIVNLLQIEIPYLQSDETLKISIASSEFESFKNLLKHSFNIANSILSKENNFSDILNTVPPCFFNSYLTCLVLNDSRIKDKNIAPQFLNFLSKIDTKAQANDVINCLDESILVQPIHDNTFPKSFIYGNKDRIDFFAHVLRLYGKGYSPSDISDFPPEQDFKYLLGGSRSFIVGTKYYTNIGGNKAYFSGKQKYDNGNLAFNIQTSFLPHQEVSLFEDYYVKIDQNYDFLNLLNNSNANFHEDYGLNGVVEVPGIYLPYSIYKNNRKEKIEDIWTAVNLGTTILGFGTLSVGIRVYRASKLAGSLGIALGSTEIFSGAAHVFLDESAYCLSLYPGEEVLDEPVTINDIQQLQEFCSDMKQLLGYVDLALIIGSGAYYSFTKGIRSSIFGADLLADGAYAKASEKYKNLTPRQKEIFESKITSKQLDEINAVLRAGKISILDQLRSSFQVIRKFSKDEGLFVELSKIDGIENLLRFTDEIKALDASAGPLGWEKGYRFLLDVFESTGRENGLGRSLDLMKSGWVKAWDVLTEWIRLNTQILEEVSQLAVKTLNGSPLDIKKLVNNGFGEILINIDEPIAIRRLQKMNQWNPKLVDDLARRLGDSKYVGLVEDLVDNDIFDVYEKLVLDPFNARDLVKHLDLKDGVLDKVGKSAFFAEVTSLGKAFENFVESNLSLLRSKILGKYPDIDINDYEIFTQVQMNTGAGSQYFVADILMVKRTVDDFGQPILDKSKALVIESKLSATTNLTTPQGSALIKVKSNSSIFEVRSILKQNTNGFTISNTENIHVNDFLKAYSDGSGNVIIDVLSLK